MIQKIVYLILTVFSVNSMAEESGFTQKTDVDVQVSNPCRASGGQCFKMNVYFVQTNADGSQKRDLKTTWSTSPGNPTIKGEFPGENTPEFTNASFTSIHDKNYTSAKRKDPMPYAMHINNTGFAIHGGYLVTGKKLSHGCLRLQTSNAKQLNDWVKKSRASGGVQKVTVRDTTVDYNKIAKGSIVKTKNNKNKNGKQAEFKKAKVASSPVHSGLDFNPPEHTVVR